MATFFEEGDENQLAEFYAQTFGKEHILNNLSYHNWQFRDNPFNKLGRKSVVVIGNKDRIFGHLGLFPVELKVFDEIKNATWFVPFYVLENHRVLGLGFMLMDFALNLFNFGLALNVSDFSRKIFSRSGWINFGNLNRYIGILDKKRLENYLGCELNIDSIKTLDMGELNFNRIHYLDNSYDLFWQNVKSRYPITINRSRKYMIWRYLDNPLVNYHFMILQNEKNIVGYAILRFEDSNEKIKAIRIIDLVVFEEYEELMLDQIVRYCYQKSDFIDFFCTGNFYKQTFMKKGFFNNLIEKIKIPTVFNPIDPNRPLSMEFLYKCNLKDMQNNDSLNDINNWFITKGDSDQDRAY